MSNLATTGPAYPFSGAPVSDPAGRTSAVTAPGRRPALRWQGVLALLLALPLVASALAAEDTSLEYQVKAGFLFRFTQFVEWPASSLPASNSTIVIGVLADDPASSVLQQALKGKVANNRRLQVRILEDIAQLDNTCHIFFLSRAQKERVAAVLRQTQGAPILTVGEVERFAEQGGVINFVRKDESFRLEVNLEVAEKAGLKISAKLAGIATLVKSSK